MNDETYNKVGKFLHVFNELDGFINLIIAHHIDPKDKTFFIEYILNTSVITFGAKIKILINLNIFNNTQIQNIRDYSNNRNVFAHTNRDPTYIEGVEQTKPNNITVIVNDVILKTNSQGKIIKMNYGAFVESHILLQNEIIDFVSTYIIDNKIDTLYNHVENLALYKK